MKVGVMRKLVAKTFCLLATVVLCVLTAAAYDDTFSCSVTDQQGNRIQGYHDEEKDQWYLFLTNQVNIPGMEVHLQGEVIATEKGTVNQETDVLNGAFEKSGDTVEVRLEDGITETITVMQSELPSLYVTLDRATLDEVHQDKNTKYENTGITLTDTVDSKNDLSVKNATFKGRGNSSWACYEKKGYQIKFDKKTGVLGMPKAKKWVLLANASDDSMMRNKIAFDLASQLEMTYVPDGVYVDLWINGDYRGTYLVCEKVEIGTNRLNLKDPKGVLMEQDEAFYTDEDIWIENHSTGKHFVVKESVTEDNQAVLQEAVQDFDNALDAFMNYLAVTPDETITLESLAQYIDVDSFLKYYLVNEYTLNRESSTTSFYWYKDGDNDVLHLGPVWDFDTCMGNDMEDAFSYQTAYIYNHIVYQRLLSIPAVQDELNKLFENYVEAFNGMDGEVTSLYDQLKNSAAMNYTRWDDLKNEFTGKGTYFAGSYQEAKENLKMWLMNREKCFPIKNTLRYLSQTNILVDANHAEMSLSFAGADAYENLWFVVWSEENGRDDIVWYRGEKQSNNVWSCAVDLAQHRSVGIYNVHVWAGNGGKPTEVQQSIVVYVSEINTVRPKVATEVSKDCQTMRIVAKNIVDYDKVYFPVWSEENGQDDIVWYPAEKQVDGSWVCTVNLADHNSTGIYLIHVYGEKDGTLELLTDTTANVEKLAVRVTAEVSEDCSTMYLVVRNMDGCDRVYLPTWSEENGQDDLIWHAAEQKADGTWVYTVNLREHHSAGRYQIHVYREENGRLQLATYTTAYVEHVASMNEPYVTAEVSEDCSTMYLVVRNMNDCDRVYLPTWSEENGQDDLAWYTANREADGTWVYTVDLREHHSTGEYQIHVYCEQNGKLQLVTHTVAYVEHVVSLDEPYVIAEVSSDCRTMQLTVKNADDYNQIYLPTWSTENGQDDIEWYAAQRRADGAWVYTVDMAKHHSAGTYNVHVYGMKGGELQMLAYAMPNVKLAAV